MPDEQMPVISSEAEQRGSRLLMLEFGSRKEFNDPSLEYRRLFAELLGTFMLVLVAAGGACCTPRARSACRRGRRPGLMVMAIILFMGAVSGAHLTPSCRSPSRCAATFPGTRARLIVVQLIGATLACLFLLAVSATSSTSARRCRARVHGVAGLPDGDRADRDAGQRDPRHRLVGAERRHDRRAGGRRLHRARRPVGRAGQRHLDEPCALVRPGARQRRLDGYWAYVAGP